MAAALLVRQRQLSTPSTSSTSNTPSSSSLAADLAKLVPTPTTTPITNTNTAATAIPSPPSFFNHQLTLASLMAANLHLGHHPRLFNKYMLPFIYGQRNGVHIINLEHTLAALRRAMAFTKQVALRGEIRGVNVNMLNQEKYLVSMKLIIKSTTFTLLIQVSRETEFSYYTRQL